MEWLAFCNKELNQPGTLIEVEWYDSKKKPTTKILLIGDINKVCGVCDDCTAFPAEDVWRDNYGDLMGMEVMTKYKWLIKENYDYKTPHPNRPSLDLEPENDPADYWKR